MSNNKVNHPADPSKMKRAQTGEAGGPGGQRRVIRRLKDFLLRPPFSDDVFISYSRADGATYAAGLANSLADQEFACRFDQWGTKPGRKIPRELRMALRRSALFVLVGTPGAALSEHVADEVREFRKTGRNIIPIIFDEVRLSDGIFLGGMFVKDADGAGAPRALWADDIFGAPLSHENGEALVSGNPSTGILNRIKKNFTFKRKDERLRKAARLLGGVLVFLAASALVASYVAVAKGKEAVEKTRLAEEAAARAEEQTRAAQAAQQEAERQRGFADEQRKAADAATLAAGDARLAADAAKSAAADAAARADAAAQKEELARQQEAEATANARRQAKVASSLGKVAQASRLISSRPEEALALSADAYRNAPEVVETSTSLLDNLQHFRNLRYVVPTALGVKSSAASCLDGRVLAAVGVQGTELLFWDAEQRRRLAVRAQPDGEWERIVCEPGGDLCAARTMGGDAFLFKVVETVSGLEVTQAGPKVSLEGTTAAAYALAGESSLVAGTLDGKVRVWDLKRPAAAPKEYPAENCDKILHMAANPSGKALALLCQYTVVETIGGLEFPVPGYRVGVWDVSAGKVSTPFVELPGDAGAGRDWVLSLSHDGKKMAVGRPNRSVIIVDTERAAFIVDPLLDAGPAVSFSPGGPDDIFGDWLVTATPEGQVAVYGCDFEHCSKLRSDSYGRGVSSLTFVRGAGEMFATGSPDGAFSFWNLHDMSPLGDVYEMEGAATMDLPTYVALNRAGDALLTVHGHEPRYWRRDVEEGVARLRPEEAARVNRDDFPPPQTPNPAQVECSKKAFNEFLRAHPPESRRSKPLSSAAVSPGGEVLALAIERQLRLYDVGGGGCRLIRELRHDGTPSALSFDGGGELLAVGYSSGETVIWDVRRLAKRHVIPHEVSAAFTDEDPVPRLVALSPGGRFLATSADWKTVRLWDVAAQAPIGRLEAQRFTDAVWAISFDPSGRRLVTVGNGAITVWDVSPDSWAGRARSAALRAPAAKRE